jgi:hypothetical protein
MSAIVLSESVEATETTTTKLLKLSEKDAVSIIAHVNLNQFSFSTAVLSREYLHWKRMSDYMSIHLLPILP